MKNISLRENNKLSPNNILTFLLVFRLIWISIIYGLSFSWFVGGFLTLIPSILEICAIVYLCVAYKKRFITPYVIIPILFFSYMIIRHTINGDIMLHGVGDLYIFSFILISLLSISQEEFVDRFYVFCKTMLLISIGVTLLSYMIYLIPANIAEYSLPTFLSNSLQRWYNNIEEAKVFDNRFFGLELHPITTANWVTYGFFLGIGAYLLRPNKSNLILLLADAFCTIIIIVDTGCRSAMLFCCTSFFFFIVMFFFKLRYLLSKKTNRLIITIIVLVILFFITVFSFFIFNLSFRAFILERLRVGITPEESFLNTMKSITSAFNDASSRVRLREIVLDLWKNNPFFGISTINISNTLPDVVFWGAGSCNTYIQILATLGILGFCLFIILALYPLWLLITAIRKSNSKNILIISLFSVVIYISMAINNFYENYMYTSTAIMTLCGYFILATGYQVGNLQKQELEV